MRLKNKIPYIGHIALGMFYGYPTCCVSHFARLQFATDSDWNWIWKTWKDYRSLGYRRCHQCVLNDNRPVIVRREEYLPLASLYHPEEYRKVPHASYDKDADITEYPKERFSAFKAC